MAPSTFCALAFTINLHSLLQLVSMLIAAPTVVGPVIVVVTTAATCLSNEGLYGACCGPTVTAVSVTSSDSSTTDGSPSQTLVSIAAFVVA